MITSGERFFPVSSRARVTVSAIWFFDSGEVDFPRANKERSPLHFRHFPGILISLVLVCFRGRGAAGRPPSLRPGRLNYISYLHPFLGTLPQRRSTTYLQFSVAARLIPSAPRILLVQYRAAYSVLRGPAPHHPSRAIRAYTAATNIPIADQVLPTSKRAGFRAEQKSTCERPHRIPRAPHPATHTLPPGRPHAVEVVLVFEVVASRACRVLRR